MPFSNFFRFNRHFLSDLLFMHQRYLALMMVTAHSDCNNEAIKQKHHRSTGGWNNEKDH